MKRHTSFRDFRARLSRTAPAALLCLLALAALSAGQQPSRPDPNAAPAAPGTPRQVPPPRMQLPGPPRRAPLATRLKTIQLPTPIQSSSFSLEQALAGQRTTDLPGNQRLDFPKIGQLAWAAQGCRVPAPANLSGPAQVPPDMAAMKVYFALPDGIYLYNPADHALQQTSDADVRQALAATLSNQAGAPTGGCQIILAVAPREFGAGQTARARTIMLLQAGRMSQSLQLQAAALGLTVIGVDNLDVNGVRRIARLPRTIEPLYVAIVGYPASQSVPQSVSLVPAAQTVKAAVLIVPPRSFQDEEFAGTKRGLELAGVQVTVASSRLGTVPGMLGGTVQAELLLNQVNVDNFNAVVFIGGLGAAEYLNNSIAQNLARQAVERQKVLAAIGTAPGILANAGVLRGVHATAFLSERERLLRAGAYYTGNPVERDGLLVTATSRDAVTLFAQAICDGLAETR
jgi:protease I